MIFVARSLITILLAAAQRQTGDDPQKPSLPVHKDSVTVFADGKSNTIENPDPSQRILVRQDLLDIPTYASISFSYHFGRAPGSPR